jgi:uncharacterized BrkB/YihY/UPF0761 family membrane protein
MAVIKTKSAWSNKLVLALVGVLIFIGIAFAIWITGAGPAVLGALKYVFVDLFVYQFVIPWWSNLWTWVTVIVFGAVAFVVVYRKQLFPKKVIAIPTATSNLQGGLIQSQPLTPISQPTVVVEDENK